MTRLLSSELLKLRSTRTAIALIASVVGLVVLIGLIATITADFEQDEVFTVDLLGIAGFAQVFALILGILAVTTEFRHGTITPTLVVAPDRVRLVLAKLVAHVLAGLILGVLAVGLTTAIVLITLSSRDIDAGLTSQEITEVVFGLILATALWAALGVGLGALVRNQVGAIVGALGWALLVENLLTIIPTVGDWVQKYGLNGVTNALSNIESEVTGDVLSQAAGGALLVAYTAAFVIAGTLAMRRRDVTS
ncbi:MAG TPA: ABC transporter permease subunit [Microbacterium sp.]|jgi:ABC-2 type transport system permease protein|nr:ABC transporter permease subunit [Microbacterium sp.]